MSDSEGVTPQTQPTQSGHDLASDSLVLGPPNPSHGDTPPSAPPGTAEPAIRVDSSFAFALCVVPLVVALFPVAFPSATGVVVLGVGITLNTVLGVLDWQRLKTSGVEVNILWPLFLVPIYLILRTKHAKTTPMIPLAWFAAFFVSLVLAGAGIGTPAGRQLDSNELDRQIQTGILSQLGTSVKVTCPRHEPMTEGTQFKCGVSSSNGSGHVQVTVQSNAGNYTWQLVG